MRAETVSGRYLPASAVTLTTILAAGGVFTAAATDNFLVMEDDAIYLTKRSENSEC